MNEDTKRREHLAAMERQYRVRGFDDGKAGRTPASKNLVYQRAWYRGVQARADEEAKPS